MREREGEGSREIILFFYLFSSLPFPSLSCSGDLGRCYFLLITGLVLGTSSREKENEGGEKEPCLFTRIWNPLVIYKGRWVLSKWILRNTPL